ncbi:hypothetical protein EV421DRAFT_1925365 [Armillaria borealis]|uniref:F-box domain-containing protein n=1 Tax=Armillaria borealis TaxID=47425 RepID=A0AA39IXV6_9AGAR|nr:hypothetical protein EV421DRAFT_1925365 [Armillaria borealis]
MSLPLKDVIYVVSPPIQDFDLHSRAKIYIKPAQKFARIFHPLVLPPISSIPAATQQDPCLPIRDLPLELFEEILSHLDVPAIKVLSLASSTLHTACFPHLFRSLSLNGDLRPAPKFLSVFQRHKPIPCLRRIELKWLKEDVSRALLPWCTKAHTAKINGSLIGNTAILPSLTTLEDLELANLSFSSVADFFALLSNLPSTLKQLKVRLNTFRDSQSTWTGSRRVELSRLETDSAPDLVPFLRADCPVSLPSLRAASLRHPKNHDLGEFIQKTSLLLDLSIETEHRPVTLPLWRLKSLSIIDRTNVLGILADFFTTPSDSDDVSSPLESLNLTFSCNNWLMPQQIFRHFAVALSQQPRFHHLKTLHLTMMRPFSTVNISKMFDGWVRRFELDLEAAGRSPRINITSEIVAALGHCLGYGFRSEMI